MERDRSGKGERMNTRVNATERNGRLTREREKADEDRDGRTGGERKRERCVCKERASETSRHTSVHFGHTGAQVEKSLKPEIWE